MKYVKGSLTSAARQAQLVVFQTGILSVRRLFTIFLILQKHLLKVA